MNQVCVKFIHLIRTYFSCLRKCVGSERTSWLKDWCRRPDSNRHGLRPLDFEEWERHDTIGHYMVAYP